jgi:hypothetical protein
MDASELTAPVQRSSARTWSFVDRVTGDRLQVTCMPGCVADHSRDMETPTHRDDIWCFQKSQSVTLPVNLHGDIDEYTVLRTMINVDPFDKRISQRMPHVDIELVDDCWIEGLDPDGLETLIGTLTRRLEEMRDTHRQLVNLRAEYRQSRQAVAS